MTSQSGAAGDRTTIMVVEDDDAVLELIRQVLAPTGARLLLAGSAEEASTLVTGDAQLDLLLTDVLLPGARGTELAASLGATRPALRVIFMTGWREHASLADAKDGVILAKPFELKELARAVANALQA